ncbi:aminotransferase-like domain-containing protein [Leeia oryzae]|uniref:aminotransferase-like domain-containing protein n=1 Tax=Leeia oryzae TaxID=356662 RepID=UPI00037D49A2|nr:PLP-dependent aminotransferase family protein [Leeia oryzae]
MSKTHRYLEISAHLSQQIQLGHLTPGSKAPSLRDIARQYQVSLGTAMQTYEHLEKLGVLRSEPKRGFFVTRLSTPRLPTKTRQTVAAPQTVKLRSLAQDLLSTADVNTTYSFGTALLHPAWQPVAGLEKTIRAVMKSAEGMLGQYIPSPGYSPLRQAIAMQAFEWGGNIHADEVLITAGATDALQLCLKAVVPPGGVVATESPAYFGLLQILENMGLKALEIPADPMRGMDLGALEMALATHQIAAIVVTPNHNNPFGSSMSDADKVRLLRIASQHLTPVIEDDVYGDLHYGPARPKPLRYFDEADQTLYCSSFSKTTAPGYRVGWCLPGQYQARVQQLQIENSIAVSSLPQVVLARFLANGEFARHLDITRARLASQCTPLIDYMTRVFPAGTRISQPVGGYTFWIELPGLISAMDVYHAARRIGILVTPGDVFSSSDRFRHCLRLSCGQVFGPEMKAALAQLGEITHQLQYAGGS